MLNKFWKNPLGTIDFLLLAAGIALLPVYVSKSGSIQPAHLVLAFFAGMFVLRNGLPRTSWSLFLLTLVAYILIVELYYSLGDWTYSYKGKTYLPIISGIFFLYNYVVAAAVYGYCRRSGLGPVVLGTFLATAIALVSVFVAGIDLQGSVGVDPQGNLIYGRSAGSFNNPNQLGFFSVCLLSIAYLLYRLGYLNYFMAMVLFFAALFLSIVSMSRAAVFANLVVSFLVFKPRGSNVAMFLWGIAIAVSVSIFLWLLALGYFNEFAFVQRYYASMDEADNSLEGRGYFAVLQANVLQVLFGLGTQNVHRIVGNEVHSTIVSVLASYGLVGLTLFGSVLVLWGKRLWDRFGTIGLICIAGPAMLYGITHNGTRFTFFWLLFASSLAMTCKRLEREERTAMADDQLLAPRGMPG